MSIIGLAEVAIQPEVSGFAASLKDKLGDAIKNPTVVAGAAIAAATGTVTAFAKSSIDKFEEVGGQVKQLTRFTGESAETMSRLRFAAQETGVSTDSLATGIKKLSVNIQGGKTDFDKLGISIKDTHGQALPMDQVLGNVAQKFKDMPNGVQKNALAIQLFGKSGTDLIPVLNKGKDGLAQLGAEADKFGLTLTQGNLDAINKNIAAHKEFSAAMDGLKVQLGANLLPVFTTMAEFINSKAIPVITELTGLVDGKLGPVLSAAADDARIAWGSFTDGFKDSSAVTREGGEFANAFAALGAAVKGAFDDARIAWGSFTDGWKNNDAITREGGLFADSFAAIGAAARDTLGFLQDFIGFLLDHQQAVKDVTLTVLGLKAAYEGWQLGTKTINFVTSGVQNVLDNISNISGALKGIGDKAIDITTKAAGGVAQGAGSQAGGAVSGQVGNVVSGAAGGALGNFFDLKALVPRIRIFATGILEALGGFLLAGLGVLADVGTVIAAVIFTPEALIAAAVAAVGLIGVHFHTELANFFTQSLPNMVRDAIGGAPSFLDALLDKGVELITGLLNGIGEAMVAVTDFFAHLPDDLAYALGYLGGTIFVAGRDLIQGLWDGAVFVFELVKGWISDIPNVVTGLLNLIDTLYQKGLDLLQGLWRGVTDLFTGSLWPWFTALPGEIVNAVGDVLSTLYNKGFDLLRGMWDGIQLSWQDPRRFFLDLALAIPALVGVTGRWLYQHGVDLIHGLRDGVSDVFHEVGQKLGELRNAVIGAVSGPATWLLEAGKDVIRGLVSGVTALWGEAIGKAKQLAGDFISGFKSAAGIKSPSTEMHSAGVNIMQGLFNGIDSQRDQLASLMGDVASTVLDPFGPGSGAVPTLAARTGAGGRSVTIGSLEIHNSKTLEENLDEIDRLYPLVVGA